MFGYNYKKESKCVQCAIGAHPLVFTVDLTPLTTKLHSISFHFVSDYHSRTKGNIACTSTIMDQSSHAQSYHGTRYVRTVEDGQQAQGVESAPAVMSWPNLNGTYNDTVVEQDDEECVNIERRSCSTQFMEACRTPEQQYAIDEQATRATWSFASSSSRSMRNPPLLRPKHPSLTHSHQPWNVPTDQEYDELSARLNVQNAPLFPHSPALPSPSQRHTHVSNSRFWDRSVITTSNTSNSSSFGPGCLFEESASGSTSHNQYLHKRSVSLPRRVMLSFKDCHFVRLPPRVARSDGYLHDITWRVQQMDTGTSSFDEETFETTTKMFTSPDRKRNKVNPNTTHHEMPMLTPVEGYTIASVPTATMFSTDDASATPLTENHRKRSDNRFTFYRDKYSYNNVDDVVYTTSLDKATSQMDDSSREATPLPLLDFDDDSESMSSWNEGSSLEGHCERYSDSPNSDTASTNKVPSIPITATVTSATSPAAIDCTTCAMTETKTSLLHRTIPMKPPKLKMRTNHPLLVQHSNFTPFVQIPPKQGQEKNTSFFDA